jgi:translation initiation factor 1
MKHQPKPRIETNQKAAPLANLSEAFPDKVSVVQTSRVQESPTSNEPVWKMGRVLLRRETAHRGGKTVVVVYDFATHLPASILEKVAKKLRSACSTGGTVKDRTIEIQGDLIAKVRVTLEAEGFIVGGVKG